MSFLLSIPLGVRLAVVFASGLLAGSFVNWAVYSLGCEPRPLSPWSRAHPRDPRSGWLDRVPLLGWWRLDRMAKQLGFDFWIRPMLVEIACGLAWAALYWWEIERLGLLSPFVQELAMTPGQLLPTAHAQFAVHAVLLVFMLAVSLIDLDEQYIPDALTIPGTLLGLMLAVALPTAALPDRPGSQVRGEQVLAFEAARLPQIHVTAPREWPPRLAGCPQLGSLAAGLSCFGLWCVALLPRVWRGRHGWRRAWAIFVTRLARSRATVGIAALAVVGSLSIAAVWFVGGDRWQALLTALVGVAIGGGLIWLVRVIASWALRREAMGFGDVTLMAMIGAYVGWQASLVVFFLAPFAGLLIGIVQFVARRDNVIAYGPYLCASALGVVAGWTVVWQRIEHLFLYPWLVPGAMAVCLALLGLLLGAWGFLRR